MQTRLEILQPLFQHRPISQIVDLDALFPAEYKKLRLFLNLPHVNLFQFHEIERFPVVAAAPRFFYRGVHFVRVAFFEPLFPDDRLAVEKALVFERGAGAVRVLELGFGGEGDVGGVAVGVLEVGPGVELEIHYLILSEMLIFQRSGALLAAFRRKRAPESTDSAFACGF